MVNLLTIFLLPLWQPCCIVWKLFNCVLTFLSSTNLEWFLHLKFAFKNDVKCCSKQKKPIDLFHLCLYNHPNGILEYALQVLFANKKSSKMMCEIQYFFGNIFHTSNNFPFAFHLYGLISLVIEFSNFDYN
jgi:hypothetical protein